MSKRLHLAIDLDDVVMDFTPYILSCLRLEYGVSMQLEEVTEWKAMNRIKLPGGRNWWDWLRGRDWLWAQVPAVEGAIGGIDALRRDGHYVEGLTSKPDWAEWTVWAWAGKWRPAFNRLTVVTSGQRKVDHSEADVLIDDAIHNIEPWIVDDISRRAIIFDRPWNREMPDGPGVRRANNWTEVAAIVKEWSA